MECSINMEEFTVTVRQALPCDEKYLLEFTKGDGWDYSKFDVKSVLSFDPGFLFVAVDHLNTPVGFGGIIDDGSNTMHLDAFIVREDLRYKGIGSKIWKAMFGRAGERNVCLDSLSGSVDWYRKHGFVHESFKLHAYCTIMVSAMREAFQSHYNILPLSENMWSFLLDYDKQVFLNLDREKSLRAWCSNGTTVLAFSGKAIVGYGCMHKMYENVYGLRNVFGDNELVVETMLRYLTAKVQDGSEIYFTLIEDKPVPRYLNKHCKFLGTSQRLFNKAVIEVNCDKIWIHSRSKT